VSAADPFALDAGEEQVLAAVAAWEALTGEAATLVAAKRAAVGPDLLSDLIAVHDARDGRLDDEELVALVATIVAAGYRTATTAIAIGAIRLCAEGTLGALAHDPAGRAAAVEEVLRIHAGQVGEPFPRYAQVDVDLDGAAVAAGDVVLVRLEAAHRDPDRYDDPDRFRPGRDAPHIAFGRGPHHCLGAALARAELDAALAALGTRLPTLRLHGSTHDITWSRGTDTAPDAVPVTW
jgi:pentalenolactone synthase